MKNKSLISLLLTAFVLVYMTFNLCKWRELNMLSWDSNYYYLYLPATIIYGDLGELKFYDELRHKYHINGLLPPVELHPQAATERVVNKYAVGTSLFELPFFLIAHGYSLLSDSYPADGFSIPYRIGVLFAELFWVLAGLFFLRKFLLQYFSDSVTAVVLLLMMFGTNLYFYTVFLIGMSHPFSFALFCFLLYLTERVYVTHSTKHIILIGAVLGMIVITRPTNIIAAMLPLFWQTGSKSMALNARWQFLKEKTTAVAIAIITFGAICMLQFGYLKYTSGEWLYYSYTHEGFNFLSPELYNGLFSYRKGWFVYTPLALIATIGFLPLYRQYRGMSLLLFLVQLVNVYIVFSWGCWWYGGGFGARAMIDALPLLSLPLAALISYIYSRGRLPIKVAATCVLSFVVLLNAFQSYQLTNELIPWDGMTKEYYWRMFGKLERNPEDLELMKEIIN